MYLEALFMIQRIYISTGCPTYTGRHQTIEAIDQQTNCAVIITSNLSLSYVHKSGADEVCR